MANKKEIEIETEINMKKEEEVHQDRNRGIEKIKECREEEDIQIQDLNRNKITI